MIESVDIFPGSALAAAVGWDIAPNKSLLLLVLLAAAGAGVEAEVKSPNSACKPSRSEEAEEGTVAAAAAGCLTVALAGAGLLPPSTRPAPWPSTGPAKGWLGAIIAGWDNVGISAGWSPSWSPPALRPLNPLLPVGTDQWGAVAGGAASVSTRARLGWLRCKGPVRAGACRSHTVRANGAPGQGRG